MYTIGSKKVIWVSLEEIGRISISTIVFTVKTVKMTLRKKHFQKFIQNADIIEIQKEKY